MKTPIADFCRRYADSGAARLHMPGHKGQGPLGVEELDLTEIRGADSLYEADGVIAESEANAAALFGARATFYSCGGSSQSIKAMCLLAVRSWKKTHDGTPTILAGRNAHKSFVQAAQLIGFDVAWLPSEEPEYALCRCTVTPKGLDRRLSQTGPVAAVFVTSPDYLGNLLDLKGLADVAHAHGAPLLVDNAHGAYLKFLPDDRHPITLGADACADSAHKTLPVLTGGGYLHIGPDAPEGFEATAREAMCLFGSTSPSYLLLQSLDLANDWLEKSALSAFSETLERVDALKEEFRAQGFSLIGDEPLKITLSGAVLGPESGVEPEYLDRDTAVLMFSPQNTETDYQKAARAFRKAPEGETAPALPVRLPEVVLQPREVLLKPTETIPLSGAEGRIAAVVDIGCPPAVLPVVPGETIDREVLRILDHYGFQTVNVIK
ncbi:MAG: amino acid decarboxylase [Clostridia bacterium]|nr:amino acid decarboxylase [Clostridia bacterium]